LGDVWPRYFNILGALVMDAGDFAITPTAALMVDLDSQEGGGSEKTEVADPRTARTTRRRIFS
jgi:hypothetical protein